MEIYSCYTDYNYNEHFSTGGFSRHNMNDSEAKLIKSLLTLVTLNIY
jgi:hypothetical protein